MAGPTTGRLDGGLGAVETHVNCPVAHFLRCLPGEVGQRGHQHQLRRTFHRRRECRGNLLCLFVPSAAAAVRSSRRRAVYSVRSMTSA